MNPAQHGKSIRVQCLMVLGVLIFQGCENPVSKNEDAIRQVVIENHLLRGQGVKSYEILDHIDSPASLTLMVRVLTDSNEKFTDTLKFPLTMDGIIIR